MKKNIISSMLLLSFVSSPLSVCAATVPNTTNTVVQNPQLLTNEKNSVYANNYQQTLTIQANELSVVERIFNDKNTEISENILKQVGYDLFSAPVASSNTSSGKYDNNYKLSIGEKVNIYLYGDSVDVMAISGSSALSPFVNSQVDSKGNIFIQGLGVVEAENRALNEVETEMNKLASQKYNSLKVKLNVAGGQDFSVFVYGQVNKPGKVLIGNNSSLIDALGAAGGIKKTGTLRKISYTTGKKVKEVDLYQTLFSGEDEDDIILKPNDKIFVSGIGNVVALKNGVAVPGIYETKDGESLQKLVSYAGGLLPATQTSEVTLTSLNKETLERNADNVSWTQAKNTKMSNGDSVEFRELYNIAENIITIQGNVKHPATYAYKEGMKLSDILKSKKELLEETFTTQAVIRRISEKDNSVVTIPVYLEEFFAGSNDPLLKPKDIINIYKNTNSEFVDVYGCINNPKQLTYTKDMSLDMVLTDVQFVETIEGSNEINVSNQQSTNLSASAEKTSRTISAENVAVEILRADETIELYYLYDIMVNGNSIKSIKLNPQDKVFFRPLRNNEIIKTVKVSGFVNNPTSFKFIDGKRLVDIIDMAGGLSKEADLRGIVYTRKNLQSKQANLARKNNERDIRLIEGRIAAGMKQAQSDVEAKTNLLEMLRGDQPEIVKKYTGQIALNIKSNDLTKIKDIDNVYVQDGDEIYIPRISNNVSVIGEVYNEQSFVYKKGATAKSYIKKVGGYTPNANKFRIYRVGVNGRAEKISSHATIEAGDIIVVPRKIAGNDYLGPICDTLKGIAAILTSVFVVTKI